MALFDDPNRELQRLQAELLAEKAESFMARLIDVTGGKDSAKVFSKK